jgi:hypothetical protein
MRPNEPQDQPPLARASVNCDSRQDLYLFPAAFFLAAQRAFISRDNFLRPAGVRPPFLVLFESLPLFDPFRFAQRALPAAASFARVAGDTLRLLELEREPLVLPNRALSCPSN